MSPHTRLSAAAFKIVVYQIYKQMNYPVDLNFKEF